MTVILTYKDGTRVTLEAVEGIQLDGLYRVLIRTFGNDWTLNRDVVAVESFFSFVEPVKE